MARKYPNGMDIAPKKWPVLIRGALVALLAWVAFSTGAGQAQPAATLNTPPPGFSSANERVEGTTVHYVRGGRGPAVILLHGFPQDWVEYRAILPRLAQRFTVIAVDLPGIGRSAPANGGYDVAHLAAHIDSLARALQLKRLYIVGHDLGGVVAYAYVRRSPAALRGAMIMDAPMPGLAGWDEAVAGLWHTGFIQAPQRLAEKLVDGRHAAFFDWFFDIGRFTPAERAYFTASYDGPQLHAAFEIYRALPQSAERNAAQDAPNSVPLVVAVGEKSFFASLLPTFVEGYRAKGMSRVEGVRIRGAGHYVSADNPGGVAELIERFAGEH